MTRRFTAFAGEHVVAAGDEGEMRRALKAMADDAQGVLLFDDMTGRQVDIDLHASADQEQRGRGRPKMGVQSREITLLPRHWEWLAAQRRELRVSPEGVARRSVGDGATIGGAGAKGFRRIDNAARRHGRRLSFPDGDGRGPARL